MGGFCLEQPELSLRLGYEAAGVIEAVGSDVGSNRIGKCVSTGAGYSIVYEEGT
jgi:NADPH:quinone reductase-like Zn-dependent oxidoreductase